MKIEHIAIWSNDLEQMKLFYEKHFQATAGEKYFNPTKNFESQTLTDHFGVAHFAISVGSKEKVNSLTETIRKAGNHIACEPRVTGDGYYESVVLDPDSNRIEITV